MDVTDTIWYSPTETLYDAILSTIEEEIKEEDQMWVFDGETYIYNDSTT